MSLPPGATGAHDPEFYMNVLKKILDAGIPFDSVCFKDASGTSVPKVVYETIKQARQMLPEGTPIAFHSHETAGVSINQYMAAIEAGATQVDLSLAPVSGGTCSPDILTMWHALRGTDFDLGIDPDKIMEVEEVFKDCMKEYFFPPEATMVNPIIPFSPLPGGADGQHADAARQRPDGQISGDCRSDERVCGERRLRNIGHAGFSVLFPTGFQQRDVR